MRRTHEICKNLRRSCEICGAGRWKCGITPREKSKRVERYVLSLSIRARSRAAVECAHEVTHVVDVRWLRNLVAQGIRVIGKRSRRADRVGAVVTQARRNNANVDVVDWIEFQRAGGTRGCRAERGWTDDFSVAIDALGLHELSEQLGNGSRERGLLVCHRL